MKKYFWQGLFFELGLVPLGGLIAYLSNQNLTLGSGTLNLNTLLWIVAGTSIPLLVGWFVTSGYGQTFPPVRRMTLRIEKAFGVILRSMSISQILFLALAAGIGEEVLFRGALHHWIGNHWTAVLFGLVHAVTPFYFALAALMSFYLGAIYEFSGSVLWVPIAIHIIYDAFALYMYRSRSIARRRLDCRLG